MDEPNTNTISEWGFLQYQNVLVFGSSRFFLIEGLKLHEVYAEVQSQVCVSSMS